MRKPWYRQGTTWTGIGAIVAAVGGILTGTLPIQEAGYYVVNGLIAIFVRRAINNQSV